MNTSKTCWISNCNIRYGLRRNVINQKTKKKVHSNLLYHKLPTPLKQQTHNVKTILSTLIYTLYATECNPRTFCQIDRIYKNFRSCNRLHLQIQQAVPRPSSSPEKRSSQLHNAFSECVSDREQQGIGAGACEANFSQFESSRSYHSGV